MPKYLRTLLLSFAVSFIAGFGLRALGGGPQSGLIGAGLGIAVFSLGSMLSGNRNVRNLSSGDREEALAAMPPPGFAHVFVFRTGVRGMAVGFDVKLDDVQVAQLKSPRFVRLVVPAGEHTLTAGPSGFAGQQSKSGSLRVQVGSGERLLFQLGTSFGMLKNQVEIVPRPPTEMATLQSMTMVAPEPPPATQPSL